MNTINQITAFLHSALGNIRLDAGSALPIQKEFKKLFPETKISFFAEDIRTDVDSQTTYCWIYHFPDSNIYVEVAGRQDSWVSSFQLEWVRQVYPQVEVRINYPTASTKAVLTNDELKELVDKLTSQLEEKKLKK